MIIYNETIIIDESINKDWLNWIHSVNIPAVMATGCFESYQVLSVLDLPNEGFTYCIQYHANGMEDYNKFNSKYQQQLQAAHQQRFENMFVMFNTLMETVDR